ncbi:dTDP-4-dehydrorhamnose reductase [Sphingomonas sp. Leaf357]|uniref:dTDP-4-dehydrorhamnose reductase n=1 Tax=Sphingomonas sp. Leaf357 TaxID=1736350 RepID=UPI0006F7BF96|nr:dTDP-4-dehydrorhamnose reductase [Sphingomonas sp. Leaf357]KQS03411.1 dTDP-4-dehydrorhamnose reductase [Sphingomonas sp. Leaf357]
MRIAVTGRNGQVVQSLIERAPARGHVVMSLGRPEFDLAEGASVRAALIAAKPDAIVSAAAYTAVDKAESEREMAFAVNAAGAGAVAEAAAALGVPLVHLSTDFVFDGTKSAPYVETDPTGPLGVYGASKLAGEQAVLAAHADSVILRTAWVYSPFGANFLKTMLRLAADRDELGVVADQFGNPTGALDIADAVLQVAERLAEDPSPDLRGVFHMTAAGDTSWAGFAEAIFAASAARGGPSAHVRHITTAEYPTPATRPGNSRLDCTKLANAYGIRLGAWQHAVDLSVARHLS